MAEFTDKDKETLERLRKAFESKSATALARQPWQEHLSRETSVSSRSSYATEIVQGFSGSWASSYKYGIATAFVPNGADLSYAVGEVPAPIRAKTLKLGLRGSPDIDFVPYNWRTNRFGSKGPSLVGHPISFSVVGPTLKSPFCDWTWQVDPGAGPNGGDTLTMDTRPDGNPAVASSLAEGYNIPNFTIGDASEPVGGLYVIISDDGTNPGSIPAGANPLEPLSSRTDTARFEVFRVASVDDDVLELHPNKPLSLHFDTTAPLPKHVRAITVVQPYVTRMGAVPGSGAGVGREKSFVVLSPERAASSDLYPPYDGGVPGDGSWLQGGFAEVPTAGAAAQYGGNARLPNPKPVRESFAVLEKAPAATAALAGQMILLSVSNPSADDVGRLVRIYEIDSDDGASLTFGSRLQAIGWFEILSVQQVVLGDRYVLSRVAEVAPETGATFFGPGPYFISASDPNHFAYFTVHDPVEEVWEGAFDLDAVEALRLRNLIDPVLVERAEKELSDAVFPPLPGGSSPARPDRAIFDTTTQAPAGGGLPSAADPGSLLDLGFRMVLFPARDDGTGSPEPDFSRPITSRNLIIDPSVQEEQYLEIDYSSGVVSLSHAPPSVAGGDIVPNGIIGGPGTSNPRNEVVLFAACVPFSMEPSQTGAGMRVSGGRDGGTDAYGSRIVANIDISNSNFVGTAPYFGAPGIVLDRLWRGPSTGVIEIFEGRVGSDGTPETRSFGLWGYSEVSSTATQSTLQLVSSLPGVSDPGGSLQLCIALRREVVFQDTSVSNAGVTDNAKFDVVYGSSQRGIALRFPGGKVTPQLDGSVAIVPALDATDLLWHQWGTLMASSIPELPVSARLSEMGILAEVVYEDDGNPTGGPSTGTMEINSSEGPYLNFRVLDTGAPPDQFRGFTGLRGTGQPGRLAVNQAFRAVFKFGYGIEPGTIEADSEYRIFVGLGPEENGSGELARALQSPPDATRSYLGLRITGLVTSPVISFISQMGGGLSSEVPILDPASLGASSPLFLVIESRRLGPEVRMALYDTNFNLMGHTTFSGLALPTNTLGVLAGILADQTLSGNPAYSLNFYHASVMTRVDLHGLPTIP